MKEKILLVEDEIDLQNILKDKLEKEGFKVTTVSDGEEALNILKKDSFDLILLDMILPKIGGMDVLKSLKKNEKLSKIPVIIISNSGNPIELEEIKKLGVSDWIIKADFTPEEVLKKIYKYLKPISENGVKILVAEDEKDIRELIKRKLLQSNFTVLEAESGEETLELIKKEKPKVVLLDIIMPGIDGFQILKQLKSNPETKDIKVIILSNLGQDSDIQKGKEFGASDYIIKANFTLDEIIKKINKLLS